VFLFNLPVCWQKEKRLDLCFAGVFSANTVNETTGKGCKT